MLGLLLLVLGTVLGMALQWQPTTPTPPPPSAGQEAVDGVATPADGHFRRSGTDTGEAKAPDAPGEVPDRTTAKDETPPSAERQLAVTVIARHADGTEVRVPFVDVTVELDGDGRSQRIVRTDASGCARFTLAAAAGQQLRVATGVGGATEVTLGAAVAHAQEQQLVVAFAPRAIAIGRVIDRGGRGVADADLVLLRWADEQGREPLFRIGRSDADGNFRVPLAVGGRLGAIAAGHAPSALHLLRAGTDPAKPLHQSFELVLLGDGATVRGVVVDGDDRPVPDARVAFDSREPRPAGSERAAPPQRVATDAQGAFVASGLTPGLLAVSAWADDYGWQQDELRVMADGEAFVTLRLPWPSRVVGVVVTTDGAPSAGARVVAGVTGSWLQATTRADAEGRFELTGLGSGPVQLRASNGTGTARTELELEPGTSVGWRAVLGGGESGPLLRGVVLGPDQRPRADWRVVVGAKGTLPRSTFTAEDGTFALTVPVKELLEVRVFAAGRTVSGFADALLRDVAIGAAPLRIVLDSMPPATIRATVAAETGGPLPAKVAAWHHERREYAQFSAGADGVLVLGMVPAGTLDLSFEHAGHARREVRDRVVTAGADLDLGQIQLDRAGSLFGTVRGPGGTVPEACELKITVEGQVLSADYQAGSYRFAAVPAGSHRLRVQGPGLGAASFPIEVHVGEDLERNLELELGLRRRIVVTAPAGTRGSVHLAVERHDHEVHWLTTTTFATPPGGEPQATFFVHMTGGTYRAVAWTDRGLSDEREVEFRFDDEPDVPLRLH